MAHHLFFWNAIHLVLLLVKRTVCCIWLANDHVCYSSIPAFSASDFRFCVIPRLFSKVLHIALDLSKHWPCTTAKVRREPRHCSVPSLLMRCFFVCAQGRLLTTLVSHLFSFIPSANENASCQKARWRSVRLGSVSSTSVVKEEL